jgi:hypothetical protein
LKERGKIRRAIAPTIFPAQWLDVDQRDSMMRPDFALVEKAAEPAYISP